MRMDAYATCGPGPGSRRDRYRVLARVRSSFRRETAFAAPSEAVFGLRRLVARSDPGVLFRARQACRSSINQNRGQRTAILNPYPCSS
jgi:hypothetical protein